MKSFAQCFDYEEGESFPYIRLDGKEGMQPCSDILYEYWMPEAIENDEFNMLILLDGEMVKARCVHFNFTNGRFKNG